MEEQFDTVSIICSSPLMHACISFYCGVAMVRNFSFWMKHRPCSLLTGGTNRSEQQCRKSLEEASLGFRRAREWVLSYGIGLFFFVPKRLSQKNFQARRTLTPCFTKNGHRDHWFPLSLGVLQHPFFHPVKCFLRSYFPVVVACGTVWFCTTSTTREPELDS